MRPAPTTRPGRSAAAEFAVAEGLTALLEYARFSNFGGAKDIDAQVFTAGAMMEFEDGWHAAASYTSRDPERAPADAQFQISGGYVFASGLDLSVGWKWVEEENIQSPHPGAVRGPQLGVLNRQKLRRSGGAMLEAARAAAGAGGHPPGTRRRVLSPRPGAVRPARLHFPAGGAAEPRRRALPHPAHDRRLTMRIVII